MIEGRRMTCSDMFEQAGDLPLLGLRIAMQLEHIAEVERVGRNSVQCHGTCAWL